ncbi:methyltransferase TRM13 [Ancylostoma duodenale]|uniref:tRNA:m(4)X modification enzyme TRM13 n=1 Tax=Ancylostoma duodenale TaxID=51022 RepID=A0A0C2CEY7_9BILA|nr:methyltransferase TRM13 [Ancylostoma duodenale]
MTLQNRCAYIIPRKGRSCRMLVKTGQKYCGEHANQEESNEVEVVVTSPFQEEVTSVVEKLQRCYESICGEVSTVQLHAAEIENHLQRNPELSESKRKHLIQQSSIIGRLLPSYSCNNMYTLQLGVVGHLVSLNLLNNDPSVCIFELGAGKVDIGFFFHFLSSYMYFYASNSDVLQAQLAYWMAKRAPRAKFLLIDRSGSRNKYDNKALQEDPSLDIKRLRCSIEHVDLSKVEMLKDVSGLCAVCKHFCGSATDAGVRCLANGIEGGLLLEGFVLVPCCHHKSRYREYCGREFLAEWGMDSEGDFAALRLIASWAVSGITLKRNDGGASDGEVLPPVNGSDGSDVGADMKKQTSDCCQQQCSDAFLPW